MLEEARAQSDDNTWRFLTLLAEEQQQDGLLLQSVLEEIRNADKAGLGNGADRSASDGIGRRTTEAALVSHFRFCQGSVPTLPRLSL